MNEPLHRTQVLLRRDQHEELTTMAARRGTSVSELIRTLVDERLDRQQAEREARIESRLRTLAEIERHCEAARQRRGGEPLDLDPAELIHTIREERDDQLLRRLTAGGD